MKQILEQYIRYSLLIVAAGIGIVLGLERELMIKIIIVTVAFICFYIILDLCRTEKAIDKKTIGKKKIYVPQFFVAVICCGVLELNGQPKEAYHMAVICGVFFALEVAYDLLQSEMLKYECKMYKK